MSQNEYKFSVPNRIQAARFLLTMLAHFRGRRIDESDSVLDIGCGPEVLLKPLWEEGDEKPGQLTGIDNNSRFSSQVFWEADNTDNRKFIQTDFLKWKSEDKFSVIWSSMSAHWITGPYKEGGKKSKQFFDRIKHFLKNDGYFACIAPATKNFYPLISKVALKAFEELGYPLSVKTAYHAHRADFYYFWNSISEIIDYGSDAKLELCGIYRTRDWQHVKTTEIGKIGKSANEKLYEGITEVDIEKVAQKIDEILTKSTNKKRGKDTYFSDELNTKIFELPRQYYYLLPYIDSFVFVFKNKGTIIDDISIANNSEVKSDLLMHTLDKIREMEGKASLFKKVEYDPTDQNDSIKKQLDNTALQVFSDIVCDPQLKDKLIYAGRSDPTKKKRMVDIENSNFETSHKWRKKIFDDDVAKEKNLFKPEIGFRGEKAEDLKFFGIALCIEDRKNPFNSFRLINPPKRNTKKEEYKVAYIGIASHPFPAFDNKPPEDADEYLQAIRGMQPEDIFSVFVADDAAFKMIVPESEEDPCAIEHFHYFRWQASYYQPNLFILSHTVAAKYTSATEDPRRNFAAFLSLALDKCNKQEQITNKDITKLAHCLKIISLLEDIANQRKLSYERLFKEDRETFRALYNLPQATIDLLKKTKIPPVSMESGKYSLDHVPEKPTKEQLRDFAEKIISRIPKADLHVHVGSCMSPEFLVAASIISLLRHSFSNPSCIQEIRKAIKKTYLFFGKKKAIEFKNPLRIKSHHATETFTGSIKWCKKNPTDTSEKIKKFLNKQIENAENGKTSEDVASDYRKFRSALHDVLGLDDHWSKRSLLSELDKKNNISVLLFALMYGQIKGVEDEYPINLSKDDLLRIVIIYFATSYKQGEKETKLSILGCDVLQWFNGEGEIKDSDWKYLHREFYEDNSCFAIKKFRDNGWKLNHCCWQSTYDNKSLIPILIHLCRKSPRQNKSRFLTSAPEKFQDDPLTYLLASGTRANNLTDYLEGCELSGAEHLQHPFLIHLYAQQLLLQFEEQGIMYAELRAAATGYTTKHFSFNEVCLCMQTAFSQAQEMVNSYSPKIRINNKTNCWLWGKPFAFNSQKRKKMFAEDDTSTNKRKKRGETDLTDLTDPTDLKVKFKPEGTLFPTKINIILTGKRHKPIQQIIQEAAAGVVFHHHEETPRPRPEDHDEQKLKEYDKKERIKYKRNMNSCHFVGFDLAGQEDGYPPEAYRKEFEQLSKMHIPITVHSGENAPSKFVESAVLDLGAKRLGHGLSVAADQKLMDRIREYRVCVELCPISNFQTNHLLPHQEDKGIKKPGRQYPLRKLLENGNAICLNTDNPFISHTNMVKECFQASYAYGGKGLSLWDLLSIIRMGFYYAFLQYPERRNIIRYAEKKILNFFEDDDVSTFLYNLKRN